jgi:hypothetical protein
MRKLMFAVAILLTGIALGACAQRSTPQAGIPTPVPVKTPIQLPTMPPVSGEKPPFDIGPIREFLASQLNLPVEQVILTFWQPVEWRDGCLGVHNPKEMCTDVITPGFALTFHAEQKDYAVNTDATGKNFRLAQEPGVLDQLPALSWSHSGGFAGVCQNLTVYGAGNYWLRDCKTDKTLAQGVLPEGHLTYLSGLWERFGTFEWNIAPPAGSADMFSDQIIFYGRGSETMTAEEQQKVLEYLAQLANELAGSTPDASGITGQVMIGPTCGGPVKAGSTECADKPYPTKITVLDQAGQVVTRITTDAEGRFSLPLPPGTYTLQPEMTGRLPMAVEQVVTVVSGQFLTVTITYDSGMR